MKAQRDLKVIITLSEREACELYISIKRPYMMDAPDEIKKEIEKCLGYTPQPAP